MARKFKVIAIDLHKFNSLVEKNSSSGLSAVMKHLREIHAAGHWPDTVFTPGSLQQALVMEYPRGIIKRSALYTDVLLFGTVADIGSANWEEEKIGSYLISQYVKKNNLPDLHQVLLIVKEVPAGINLTILEENINCFS